MGDYFESLVEGYEAVLADDPDHLLANYALDRALQEIEGEEVT
jgi:hypothetical protein